MNISVEKLESLISEVTKERPDQKKLKVMLEEVGIAYCADQIEQMNQVLQLISSPGIKAQILKNKQKVVEV